VIRELRVKCLPADIPKHIEVDVSGLEIGHGLCIKDLKISAGIEVLADPKAMVVNVVSPTKIEEITPEAAAEAAAAATLEPEVIGKGKKEDEEEPPVDEKKPKESKESKEK
jgi:large subunit ribosomal protein L25